MAGRFSVEAVFRAVDRITAPVTRMQNRVGKFTRSMSRGLRTLNKTVDKLAGGLRRAAGTGVKALGVGVGIVAASIGLLVREFSKVEDAQAAFTPLLGGVEKAKKLVEELNKTAASTPFQFQTLADRAGQLLPVMDGDIQNTIKTLRMLGDAAGGNAQKLDSITRGFTKAMLKGKVDMESLNMIAEAGVPIFGDLADVMGVEVNSAFFKMISAGKVTTTQLTAAFEKMTGEGGKFFNGMQIASATTTGLWSTLKDNISLTAATLGGVLAPTVKDVIKGATGVARRVREWVTANRALITARFLQFVDFAREAVLRLVEAVKKLLTNAPLLDRMKQLVSFVADAFIFLGTHGATILKIVAALTALSIILKVVAIATAAVNLAMSLNPIGLIIIAVTSLIALLAIVVSKWDSFKSAFSGFSPTFDADFDPDDYGESSAGGDAGPSVVSPQERTARSIEEQRTTSSAEVTVTAGQGTTAEVTRSSMGGGLKVQQSGAF